MIKIYNPRVILPRLLATDERFRALQIAVERQLQFISEASKRTRFLSRLDELDGLILDILAEQFHVDNFDLVPLTEQIKRALIRNSILDHRIKGTKAAVEKIMRLVFGKSLVEEWFQYQAEPYRFRIRQDISSDDEDAAFEVMNRLRLAVDETKNIRSVFDGFIFDNVDLHDSVSPQDRSLLTLEYSFIDRFDYRAGTSLFDAGGDFGNGCFVYDGKLSFGGNDDFRGFRYHSDYGRLQAADFEQMSFALQADHNDVVSPRDPIAMIISTEPYRDHVEPTDAMSPIEVAFSHSERNDIAEHTSWLIEFNPSEQIAFDERNFIQLEDARSDRATAQDGMSVLTLRAEHQDTLDIAEAARFEITLGNATEFVEPEDNQSFIDAFQPVAFDGSWHFNAEIAYAGDLHAQFAFDTDIWRKWLLLKDQVEVNFREACPECGGTEYHYDMGAVRIGGERFLVTDPQIPSVRISCQNCSRVLAEFLIPTALWHAQFD